MGRRLRNALRTERIRELRTSSLLPLHRLRAHCLRGAKANWSFDQSRKNRSCAANRRISWLHCRKFPLRYLRESMTRGSLGSRGFADTTVGFLRRNCSWAYFEVFSPLVRQGSNFESPYCGLSPPCFAATLLVRPVYLLRLTGNGRSSLSEVTNDATQRTAWTRRA